MDRYERVSALDNEFQAMAVENLLSHEKIPHVIHSNHDTAYDGVFQTVHGWGEVSAPVGYHDKVRAVLAEVSERATVNKHTSE